MKDRCVYGYIRISDPRKQGDGTSLQEQRDAIERYASKHGLSIIGWFEDRQTAARQGRAAFDEMLSLVKRGKASGFIIHKQDRGARNMADWGNVTKLVDAGVEVHFAQFPIDLRSRAGRLTADVLAAVSADYIRNLREEVLKGFYGRLKQGLYPLPAPIGYQDMGSGKPKEPDPISAPLVKLAFELYASRRYGRVELTDELHRRGLMLKRRSRSLPVAVSRVANTMTLAVRPFLMALLEPTDIGGGRDLAGFNTTIPGIGVDRPGGGVFRVRRADGFVLAVLA